MCHSVSKNVPPKKKTLFQKEKDNDHVGYLSAFVALRKFTYVPNPKEKKFVKILKDVLLRKSCSTKPLKGEETLK